MNEETSDRSAEWRAFDRVLNYINTLENRDVPKKEIYAAVMEMRPGTDAAPHVLILVREAYTAMRLASEIPAVAAEYDFQPVIINLRNYLSCEPRP